MRSRASIGPRQLISQRRLLYDGERSDLRFVKIGGNSRLLHSLQLRGEVILGHLNPRFELVQLTLQAMPIPVARILIVVKSFVMAATCASVPDTSALLRSMSVCRVWYTGLAPPRTVLSISC